MYMKIMKFLKILRFILYLDQFAQSGLSQKAIFITLCVKFCYLNASNDFQNNSNCASGYIKSLFEAFGGIFHIFMYLDYV